MRKGCVSTCTNSAKALVEPLEARVLYSADGLGMLAGDTTDHVAEHTAYPLFNTDSTVALDSGAIALELASYGATAGESGTDEIHTAPEVANSDAAGSAGLLRTIQSLTDNEPPTLTGFPVDDPVFTETGGVVLLGPDLVVADAELDLSDNYDGFTVRVEITNGADPADDFDLGGSASGTDLISTDGSSTVIGKVLQNNNGVLRLIFNGNATQQIVQDTLRSVGFSDNAVTGEHSLVELQWTLNDNNDGSQGAGGALTSIYNSRVSIVPSFISAVDDYLETIVAGEPLSIAESTLLDNDTGLLSSTAQIIDVTRPTVGALSDTLVYTSNLNDTGAVSFDYTSMAGNSTLISQWPLVADGTDNHGSYSGTVHGDGVGNPVFSGDDYIELPNIVYPDTFALTFDFNLNDLATNDREEVFYSHGEYRESNSILIWATGETYEEASDRGKMWTYIRDSNDPNDTFGFDIDITGLDQNIWHNYTVVIEAGVGTKIWIDNELLVDDPRGSDPLLPTLPAYIGVEYDSNEDEKYFYHLTDHQMANLRLLDGFDGSLNEFGTATVSLDLRNEEVLVESSIEVDEDETYPITNSDLLTTDLDNIDAELVYEVTGKATFGTLLLNTTELSFNDTFTQEDVNQGDVFFRHGGNESATVDSMDLTVDDGEGSTTDVDLQITLTSINDAPFLADGTLGSIIEDNTDPDGDAISSIFSTAFTDDDPTAVFEGIAIASNADVSHGAWQYSTDSGANWYDVGTVADTAALMLKRTAYLRFLPDLNYHGNAPELQIYAVDDTYVDGFTAGTARVTPDVSVRGGSTPFSLSSATIDNTVTSINDAPALGDGSLADVEEDDTNSAGELISSIFSGKFSDADTDGSFAGIAVSGNVSTAAGSWQYLTGSGGSWNHFTPVSITQAALLDTSTRLRFLPAENYDGDVPSLEVYAIDNTFSGVFSTDGAEETFDISSRGDGTPFSVLSTEVSVAINPVFDSPSFTNSLPVVTVTEDIASDIDLSTLGVDAGDWNGVVKLHFSTSNGGVLTALDENSELVTGESLLLAGVNASALNDYLSTNAISYLHPDVNHHGDSADVFTIRLLFGSANYLAGDIAANVDIASVNDVPVLSGYDNPVITGVEDQVVAVTIDDLQATSTDVEDPVIDAMQVQDVLTGTLHIGADEFEPGVNDTIDADNIGYWQPALNSNGNIDAFSIRGVDTSGGLSAEVETVKASVAAVNDVPDLKGYENPIFSTAEDTTVELSLADLASASSDPEDGALSGLIVVPGTIAGELELGSVGSLAPYTSGFNDRIDENTIAAWTPPANETGEVNAFSVQGVDGEGLLSDNIEIAIADVTPVNDAPTLAENESPFPAVNEDSTTELTLSTLKGLVDGNDIDGTITGMIVDSVPVLHSLKIGPSESMADPFEAGKNDTIDEDNHAYWTPSHNLAGVVTEVFTVSVVDNEGLQSVAPVKLNIALSAVNDAPTISTNSGSHPAVFEDVTTEFQLETLLTLLNGDDVEGDISKLVVDSVPSNHTLKIGQNSLSAKLFEAGVVDTIDDTNHAYWTPEENLGDTTAIAFTVFAEDGEGLKSEAAAQFIVEVVAVNDAPTIAANIEPFPIVLEDITTEFRLDALVAEMQGDDVDGSIEALVVESVPAGHELRIGPNSPEAEEFEAGVFDTIDESNHAYWTAKADLAGTGIAAFTLLAEDDSGLRSDSSATIKVDVLPVNDAPEAINSVVSIETGSPYVLSLAEFGFEDRVENDTLSSVQVTELPDIGQLLYLETPVVAGQEIDIVAITDGHLRYVPPISIDGDSIDTKLEFKVRDSGGTVNDGVDLSENSAILGFNIVAVDLPPVITGVEELPFRVAENSPPGTVIGTLTAIDPDPVFTHLSDGNFNVGARGNTDVNRYSADGEWLGSGIGSWEVVSGNVDLRGELWESGPDGGYPLDLNGDSPAVIEQRIATQAGAPYRLEFALAGNFRSTDTEAVLEVTVGDQSTRFVVEKTAGWSEGNLGWEQQSIPFIATDSTTAVSFRSLDSGDYGPVIADINVYDELSFELVDSNLPFEISNNSTLIATDTELDYETQSSYVIDVRVSELGGNSSIVSYPVEILDVNESPVQSVVDRLQTIAGTEVSIGSDLLAATDVDAADQRAGSLIYTVKDITSLGQLYLDGAELAGGDSFSQTDIDLQRLTYIAEIPGDDSFSYELADGGENGVIASDGVFAIAVYEPLRMVADSNWVLSEGETVKLSASYVDAVGGYYDDQNLMIEVTQKPDSIEFLNTESGAAVSIFSKETIHSGAVLLQHDGSEPSAEVRTIGLTLHRIHEDSSLFVDSASIELNLTDIANAPVGADSNLTTDHATELTITVEQLGFSDGADGDTLRALLIAQTPQTGTLLIGDDTVQPGTVLPIASVRDGEVVYRPDPSTVGTLVETIGFQLIDSGDVSSGGVNISEKTYSIFIRVVSDHAPLAQIDNIVVDEGGIATILESGNLSLIDNDIDIDTAKENLRVVLEDEPQHGEVTLREDGTFSYQHDRSETVSDRFSYRIFDEESQDTVSAENTNTLGLNADSGKTWVNIKINPVDDSPIAGVVEDQSVIAGRYFEFGLPDDLFRAYYSDDALEIVALQSDGTDLPRWLHFDPKTGIFSGVPNINQIDSLEIQVVATDTDLASSQVEFNLSIEPPIEAAKSAEVTDPVLPQNIEPAASSSVKPAVGTEALSSARQSTVESQETNTDKQIPEADYSERFVAYQVYEQREIGSDFEDKIVKHVDKKIVREVPEQAALIADPLDTADLRQLYFSSDDFKVNTTKRILDQLDSNREELASGVEKGKIVFNGAASVSVGLSISYFLWLLKSGALLSSALSAMPAWRLIDPVPILQDSGSDGDGEDESLESMVEETDEPDPEDSKNATADANKVTALKFWSRK